MGEFKIVKDFSNEGFFIFKLSHLLIITLHSVPYKIFARQYKPCLNIRLSAIYQITNPAGAGFIINNIEGGKNFFKHRALHISHGFQ